MSWIQITFSTSGELANLLSECLLSFGALSVTLKDGADQPIYEPDPSETPVWDNTQVLALLDADADVQQLCDTLQCVLQKPLPPYDVEIVKDQDWERAWMDRYKPMHFGHDLWICPSWCEPVDVDATNILFDPGLAFGTGTHATTALCLQWLAENPPTNLTVCDYGCGSGILSVAAAILGAKQIYAVDISQQALDASKDNAQKNQCLDKCQIYLADEFEAQQVDLILANILAKPLMTLAPLFADMLKQDGQLILSGILSSQQQEIIECYQQWFSMESVVEQDDWCRISLKRKL